MAQYPYGGLYASQPSATQLRGAQMQGKGNVFGRSRQAVQEQPIAPSMDMTKLEELFSKYMSNQTPTVQPYQPQVVFQPQYQQQYPNPEPEPEPVATPVAKAKVVKPVKGLAPSKEPVIPKPISAGTAAYRARRAPGGVKYAGPV